MPPPPPPSFDVTQLVSSRFMVSGVWVVGVGGGGDRGGRVLEVDGGWGVRLRPDQTVSEPRAQASYDQAFMYLEPPTASMGLGNKPVGR